MTIDRTLIDDYLADESRMMLFWNADDELDLEDGSNVKDYIFLFVVLSGQLTIQTGCNEWQSKEGSLHFYAYDRNIRFISKSPDYSSVGVILSRDFWDDKLMSINPSVYAARLFPFITVDARQTESILDFVAELRRLRGEGRSDFNPLVLNIVSGLFFLVGKAYENYITTVPRGSALDILSRFADCLDRNYREHREVEFYADELSLSRSYFSRTIQKSTGYSVGYCIKKYTALKACYELKNATTSVKEIAIDLHFHAVSNFCKFFRHYMGMSPEEYRQKNRQKIRNY